MENYEQNYSKAIEIARNIYSAFESKDISTLITIFSDLKEIENEKIFDELKRILAVTVMPKPTKREIFNWLGNQEKSNTFKVPETSIKDAEEVTSRMQYINDDMKPIAEFIMEYANWDLHKDVWNQPTLTVPLFRVLDALILSGKPYSESDQNIEKQGEKTHFNYENANIQQKDFAPKVALKFKVGDIVQYITDSTDRRKIEEIDTFCNMYHTDSSPIMFEVEDEWKVVVNAEDVESESANKVESKFKEGYCIVPYNITPLEIWKVININDDGYYNIQPITNIINTEDDEIYRVPGFILEKDYRLWSIQDAKDGDVLVRNNDILSICIFSHFSGINNKFSSFLCHCGLEGEGLGQELSINGYHDNSENYVLANKEQCDLLFRKIKEAGYEWDSDKKELRKVMQKKLDTDKVIE